jgi:hypothetical protein
MADLTQTLANLNGKKDTLALAKGLVDGLAYQLANHQVTNSQEIAGVVAQLQGVDTFGAYSSIDQVLRTERFAGKSACVDFVKANPACTEAEAVAAWSIAGMAATGLPVLLQDPEALGQVYRANLLAAHLVPDATWESQRSWLNATSKEIIMGA